MDTTIDDLIQAHKDAREAALVGGGTFSDERIADELSEFYGEPISGVTVNRWRSDHHVPDEKYHPALAQVLGISRDDVERAVGASRRRRRERELHAKMDDGLRRAASAQPAPTQARRRGSRAPQ